MEPRFWLCKWKKEFLMESTAAVNKVRLDILVMRLALLGPNDTVGNVVKNLKMKATEEMKKDLLQTLKDAQQLTVGLLKHGSGPFDGLDNLESVEGIDELQGVEKAIAGINKTLKFPSKAPDTMEADELVQLSIIFIMLEYIIA